MTLIPLGNGTYRVNGMNRSAVTGWFLTEPPHSAGTRNREEIMPETLQVCRCGQPMTDNGTGAIYCEHCDRGCKKTFCSTCKTFQKACDPHCGCQA